MSFSFDYYCYYPRFLDREAKIQGKCGKGLSDIPGLFLKQLPLGQCLKRCEQFIESDRWWLEKKVVHSI